MQNSKTPQENSKKKTNSVDRHETISIEDHFKDVTEKGPAAADLLEENAKNKRPAERANDYQKQGFNRQLAPSRIDPFATPQPNTGDQTPSNTGRTSYAKIMKQNEFERDKKETLIQIAKIEQQKKDQKTNPAGRPGEDKTRSSQRSNAKKDAIRYESGRRRGGKEPTRPWDQEPRPGYTAAASTPSGFTPGGVLTGETPGATPALAKAWAQTPVAGLTPSAGNRTPGLGSSTPAKWGATPGATPRRWEATPKKDAETAVPAATPRIEAEKTIQTPHLKRSRWDETPDMKSASAVPDATPRPTPMTPQQVRSWAARNEFDLRNLPLSDKDLDALLPRGGYAVVPPPDNYVPARTPGRRLLSTPTPFGNTPGFTMPDAATLLTGAAHAAYGIPVPQGPDDDIPDLKPSDMQFFGKLVSEGDADAEAAGAEALKERTILKLLLKVKNGLPPTRKLALRQITEKALIFGAGPLFHHILPMLMSPALEDQERHLMVKVVDRVMYRLDDKVRPYVHKILVVIEPLLIDENFIARAEGREIVSNLAKAAGLATMISTMRPDIDNVDEYVRNTTARAFAVVASALSVPSLLPFLRAVCQSKKSWQARHTGMKIVQQIAILIGCGILPHLKSLVEIIQDGLLDEQNKVRTICALALAALAEAAHPYGIESFDCVLRPLWRGIKKHRGKTLAAFIKAIGYIIPLMDAGYANYYTREVMHVLTREFNTPDEEMKKIVLKVVKQCVSTEGVHASYVQSEILPDFFRYFWVRRTAMERNNYAQLIETTAQLAQKVGAAAIISRLAEELKDDNETFRKMALESAGSVLAAQGAGDIDVELEEQLVDGALYCFQEQHHEDPGVVLRAFAAISHSLGRRLKPYVAQILALIKWRLNNKAAAVRQYAADLLAHIAPDLKTCGEEKSLGHLGVVLYEYLGEEYPEVLGSILGALKAIVNVIGMADMTPPVKDLLPRLTPILKNRHEKVQENVIDLVGRIADRGAEYVSPKEWMRICFELLETLKARKKAIRRAAVNTFGYISKAIGPSDVLATLLNNLRVQERQNRICTTVAIAIVAETCGPFTVLPALMNEYRVHEINVRNGVLKSLAFLFEYIGEMGKDYVYSVLTMLEDALTDRDLVHRQTTCVTVKHIALGVAGRGYEDAMFHLINMVLPNCFETSPHMINGVTEALDGMRLALGPGVVINYILQGLFHPARKVRTVYWRFWNNLYIGCQDGLVAFYPDVPNSEDNVFYREELDYFL